MRMKSWSGVFGLGMLAFNIACAQAPPLSPTEVNSGVSSEQAAELTATPPVVTLLPDLTVNPTRTTVSAGSRVRMVNQSGRYAVVHSYNCSEFNMVNLPNGGWVNTTAFRPAGKTCDFFVWDVNWSRKLFEGQVVVQ